MKFKGTKGEWKVKQHENSDLCDVFADGNTWFIAEDIKFPDAQLIAAAPELLKMLQEITGAFEFLADEVTFGDTLNEVDFDRIQRSKSLINKALGQ